VHTEVSLMEMSYWELVHILGDEYVKGMRKQQLVAKILGGKEIQGGNKICYVDDPIAYLTKCYNDLSKGGSLFLEVPIKIDQALSDPATKTFFGNDYFTYFTTQHGNWRGIGQERDYPGFRILKQAFVGHIKKVELIK